MNKITQSRDNYSLLKPRDSSDAFDFFIILTSVFSLILSLLITFGKVDENSFGINLFGYLITPISCVLAIVLLCVKRNDKSLISVLKPTKQNADFIIATLLITIGMLFGLSELNYYFVDFLQSLGLEPTIITLPEKTPLNVFLTLVFLAIVPAVFEEIIFRGLIANGFKGLGDALSIILSGLLFSLYHMNPAQTIYQFLVGCLYALIVVKGGSYVLTICSHLFNNAFIILNEYFFKFAPVGISKILLTSIGLICLVAGVILLLKKPKNKKTASLKEAFFGIPVGIAVCLFIWIVRLFG